MDYIFYQLLLIILFSYKKQIQKVMQQSGKGKNDAQDQINLMLQLTRLEEKLTKVDKTLILYQIYTQGSEKVLVNLHSIGGATISPLNAIFKGTVQEENDEIKYYAFNEQKAKENGLMIDQVKLRHENNQKNKFKEDEQDPLNYINIKLFEGQITNKEKVRVVTIPILKSLQDKQDIQGIAKKKKEIQTHYCQLRKKAKGTEAQELQNQSDKQVQELQQNQVKKFLPKHLKMFIIQALFNILKKKTTKVSICEVTSFENSKNSSKEELCTRLKSLFKIPDSAIQFIVHSVEKKKIPLILKRKDIFSGIWTFTGEQQYKFSCENSQWFNDSFYTEDINSISSNLYSTDNRASSIGKVINMFTKSWSDIIFNSTTCIAPFIQDIYTRLQYGQKLSQSLVSKQKYDQMSLTPSTKQINQLIAIYTFKQIEDMYIPKVNGAKELHKIDFFFNQQRLDGFKLQRKQNQIPEDVGSICFVHFFHKINNQFCDTILQYEKKTSKERLEYILEHLKSIYQLANNIKGVSSLVKSSNMSKYYDFLYFLYNSVELIESVTKSTLPITSVIKSFFNKLKQQQNRLLTYIQSNQDKIISNQELNYYLIYLKIIEEINKNAEDSVLQIKLFLHLNKADMISTRYTIYPEKIVQAIISYCTILSLRNRLPDTRRERFNKLIIEKRIAKLLSLCKLHEEALKIFKKNHLIKSVQRCYKDIFLLCDGDERATRHIEFGKYLQSEVSFSKAIDSYECAYEFARTTEKRKESLRAKLDCKARRNASIQEGEINIQRFLSGQITEEEFDSLKKVGEDKSEGDILFQKLMNKLVCQKNKCKILE